MMIAAISDFLEFLLVERGASANTLIAYDHDLRQFAEHIREGLRPRSEAGWQAVDPAAINRFTRHLKEQGYRGSSIARKLAVVRSFFAFLEARGAVSGNPAAGLASPRLTRPPRRPPAPGDVERLLEQPTRETTPQTKRDRAMLELLCTTGMRVSELVALDVDDLQLDRPVPFIRCLGGKSRGRTVPVTGRALDALRTYVDAARPGLLAGKEDSALFLNRRGERLSRQGLWLNLKKYARAAGLGDEIAPRTLRYSYASRLLKEGVSFRQIQEVLGHGNMSTTRAYLGLIRNEQARPALFRDRGRGGPTGRIGLDSVQSRLAGLRAPTSLPLAKAR